MSCKHREKDNCKKDGRPCIHNSDCFEPIPITNADRIRAMSDEELAKEYEHRIYCGGCPVRKECDEKIDKGDVGCADVLLEWLKQPVPDDER